jgi:CO/xanthine dehydrogenase Mo-binding subunit
MVEVPNEKHPQGIRGVGEVPITPPLAAVANAVRHAIGSRLTELPLAPPKVLAAMQPEHKAGWARFAWQASRYLRAG